MTRTVARRARPARRLAAPLLACLLLAAAACDDMSGPGEAIAPRRDIVGTEQKLYSQHDEELVIRDYFQDRRDGFFLDVGCAWPVHHSTTLYLERHLGWSGIGVDALVEYARPWARTRPRSRFFNYLVTDHAEPEAPFYRADWPGLSSVDPERIEETGLEYQAIEVPSITLDALLEQAGVTRVDFLSLDIEGAQLAALSGFDIEKYAPELACVEKYEPDREAIFRYFREHGYALLERYAANDAYNWYFAPVASAGSADPGGS